MLFLFPIFHWVFFKASPFRFQTRKQAALYLSSPANQNRQQKASPPGTSHQRHTKCNRRNLRRIGSFFHPKFPSRNSSAGENFVKQLRKDWESVTTWNAALPVRAALRQTLQHVPRLLYDQKPSSKSSGLRCQQTINSPRQIHPHNEAFTRVKALLMFSSFPP